jgi:magnesium chelatase family protein
LLAKVYSGAVVGVEAYSVEIEVNCGGGDPQIVIVGLPDAAVKESKDRVYTALMNSAFFPPRGRTTINLAPADIRKEGPSFDLPIALGMLAATGDIEYETLERLCVIGELALSGEVRRARGILPIAVNARNSGLDGIILPRENAAEAAVVEGLKVYPVDSLREAADFLAGNYGIEPLQVDLDSVFNEYSGYIDDFDDVKGQESAKRAIEVAVAGGHNILCIGPPGTGKSMLAKRVPSILPPLTLEEALEVTRIHSIAGSLPANQPLIARRPFRTPHHTISDAGLLGGGTNPMPGEVSLAHHGILFLDELPEFKRNVLEVMRQPLEDGSVTISRAAASVTYPSRFMMVAAMNPCPCGYCGDPKKECRCSSMQIQRYRNKISGPLLDRIDIHVEVPALHYRELTSLEKGESSREIRERILAARRIQQQRYRDDPEVFCNAGMRVRDMQRHCHLDQDSSQHLKMAINELNFSARAYNRILKVSRTIADLEGSEAIRAEHISEAIQYRTLDKQMWV